MGFLPPKGASHIESRKWPNTHLGRQTQYHKQANNNMDIKIKRDIYTTTWELKANMNNRQDKEKDFIYGKMMLHERKKERGWV